MGPLDIYHDDAARKFFVLLEGGEAQLVYAPAGEGVLDFQSTFVPESERGRGVGECLVRRALDFARAGGYLVVPTCWFVRDVIGRRPEYRDLMVR